MNVACDNVPYSFVVSRGLQRGGAISAQAIIRKRVPVDMAVWGVHIQALTAAGPSLSLALNIRADRDGQSLVFTKEAPLVPAALWMGTNGAPFRWRAPRIWRQNDQIEVTVDPTDGVTICQLTVTFFGERIVSKKSPLWAWDRRDLGYAAVVFEMLSCPQPGVSCEPGDPRRSVLNMGGWSYELCLDEISALVVDPATDPNLPVIGESGEFQIFASFAQQWLSDEYMPLSFAGGQSQDGSQPETYRPVAAPLGGGLVVPSNGHIEVNARALRGSTDPLGVWIMLHGQRKPASELRRGVEGC